MWSFLAGLAVANAFYLPGLAPKDYRKGDKVTVLVNRLTSDLLRFEEYNQVSESVLLGHDYYDEDLQFCQPEGGPASVTESIGSVLFGDRIYTSPMQFGVLEDVECHHTCQSIYSNDTLAVLAYTVMYDFFNHWSIDGLPIAGAYVSDGSENVLLDFIPVGEIEFDEKAEEMSYYINNHFDFVIEYHELANGNYRIVGASVTPSSRRNNQETCDSRERIGLTEALASDIELPVAYSYSVKWKPSETVWATRWDKYLRVFEPDVNWFALINSSVVVCFLALLVSLVVIRMFRRDIAKYNEVDLSEDMGEVMGWKLVHGDVFRPPQHRMIYAVFAGSGAQIMFSAFTTIVIAMIGLISPANRGYFSTSLLMFASIGGAIGGYVSASVYKAWGGAAWKTNLILTPIYVPSQVFAMFVLLNFFMIANKASGAVPFGNIVAVVAIWILISVPLSLLAGFIAFKRQWPEPPTRVNQIPRQIPIQPWYLHIVLVTLASGALGVLSIGVQMYYIFDAIWFQRLYYMFGFLFTSLFSMVLIAVVFNALVLYLTLESENYHWQWRSFWVTGGTAIYLFAYSILYMVRHMHLHTKTGKFMYILYCLMGCGLCYLALGFVGIATSYVLVRKIYSRLKID